jgi:hypothetical protein
VCVIVVNRQESSAQINGKSPIPPFQRRRLRRFPNFRDKNIITKFLLVPISTLVLFSVGHFNNRRLLFFSFSFLLGGRSRRDLFFSFFFSPRKQIRMRTLKTRTGQSACLPACQPVYLVAAFSLSLSLSNSLGSANYEKVIAREEENSWAGTVPETGQQPATLLLLLLLPLDLCRLLPYLLKI